MGLIKREFCSWGSLAGSEAVVIHRPAVLVQLRHWSRDSHWPKNIFSIDGQCRRSSYKAVSHKLNRRINSVQYHLENPEEIISFYPHSRLCGAYRNDWRRSLVCTTKGPELRKCNRPDVFSGLCVTEQRLYDWMLSHCFKCIHSWNKQGLPWKWCHLEVAAKPYYWSLFSCACSQWSVH